MGIVNKLMVRSESYLREFVYGGIDGAITTFAVVAGATGAGFEAKIVIVLGVANLIADGLSMSVGSYLSSKSEIAVDTKQGKEAEGVNPVRNAMTTFVAFVALGLVPLLSYILDALIPATLPHQFITSVVLTLTAFVIIGLLKSNVARTSRVRGVFETVALGAVAAGVAFGLGVVLERAVS